MAKSTLTREQILAQLNATPASIAALTADLSPLQLQIAPAAGEWSANDVLAHLRACADMWGSCIARMIAEEHPTLRAINPRSWIKKTNYRKLEFMPSLRAFTQQRAELLAVLEPLPREQWLRAATVTGAGKVLERTVFTYARWLARHERPHIKQIERIANAVRG